MVQRIRETAAPEFLNTGDDGEQYDDSERDFLPATVLSRVGKRIEIARVVNGTVVYQEQGYTVIEGSNDDAGVFYIFGPINELVSREHSRQAAVRVIESLVD